MAWGRVALLGDAAHPVLPFLAQGGALAIEDAAALAASLTGDVPAALRAYASGRLRRVRRVQRAARRNGAVYHAAGPIAWARNLVMRRLGPEGMAERYAWLYGWTPPADAACIAGPAPLTLGLKRTWRNW
jgi:salicylate hydroxylase